MAAALLVGLAGCTPWWQRAEPDPTVLDLVIDARRDAEKLPESPERDALLGRLETVRKMMRGEPTSEASRAVSHSQWVSLFGPHACEVSYFTRLADFDGDGTTDGLVVRVRVEDRFGDPIKVLGAFRIETFTYVMHSTEKRGSQLHNWYVSLYDEKDIRRFYDSVDRSFRFPLKFAEPFTEDRLVVQATYYVPDGSGRKLFADRVVKVGQ